MRTVDIVFLYEHAARELDVSCAMAAGLRQKGLTVEVVHWPTGFPKAVLRVKPKVVVLPFCYTEQSYDALLAYWRTSIFFNITWEQLFYLGNQKAKTPRGQFATQYVIHHAWSKYYESFLNENGISTFQMERIGIADIFVEHGPQKVLRSAYGIDVPDIVEAARRLMGVDDARPD